MTKMMNTAKAEIANNSTFRIFNMDKVKDLLLQYGHLKNKETAGGMWDIYDEWMSNKGWLLERMSLCEGYNGRGQVVIPDWPMIHSVSFQNVERFIQWVNEKCVDIGTVKSMWTLDTITELLRPYLDMPYSKWEDPDTLEKAGDLRFVTEDTIKRLAEVNAEYVDTLDEKEINLHLHKGQKIMPLIEKAAKVCGLDQIKDIKRVDWRNPNSRLKDFGWNDKKSQLADSIVPSEKLVRAVLSVAPYDFYTMSFGRYWASCHTIDKKNLREARGDHFSGCFCAGTNSYLMDGCSAILYFTKGEAECPEDEDKVKRAVVYFDLRGAFVLSRVYPDGRDGGGDPMFRPSVIKLVESLVEQMFKDEINGRDPKWIVRDFEKARMVMNTDYEATHYADYDEYQDINLAYMRGIEEWGTISDHHIVAGHGNICPQCGEYSTNTEYLLCNECRLEHRCHYCGSVMDEEDVLVVNGHEYCDWCATRCYNCGDYMLRQGSYRVMVDGDTRRCCNNCLVTDFGDYVLGSYNIFIPEEDAVVTTNVCNTIESTYSVELTECSECGGIHNRNDICFHHIPTAKERKHILNRHRARVMLGQE